MNALLPQVRFQGFADLVHAQAVRHMRWSGHCERAAALLLTAYLVAGVIW